MANEAQVALLNKSAEESNGMHVWNQWRKENPTIQVDLIDAHLPGIQMKGVHLGRFPVFHNGQISLCPPPLLDYVDFTGADLSSADLSGAHVIQADFSSAILVDSKLGVANFAGTKFFQAVLRGADLLGADLHSANLIRANASRVQLSNANLASALCIDANFEEADLNGAMCQGAIFRNANLRRANLTRVNLYQAKEMKIFQGYQLIQFLLVFLCACSGLVAWTFLDNFFHWTSAFPWLSGSIGVIATAGSLILILQQLRDSRATGYHFEYIVTNLQKGMVGLLIFLGGVSHIYQSFFVALGGFSPSSASYQGWLLYQVGWFIDIILFNLFDIFNFSLSTIRPVSFGAQILVFGVNLVLATLVLSAVLRASNDRQSWRRRINEGY